MFIEIKSHDIKKTLEEIVSLLSWETISSIASVPVLQALDRAQSLLVDIETGEADMEGFINEMAAAFDETMAGVPF